METARLFNSAIAAAAIAAAFELGILEELEREGVIEIPAYCDSADLHPPTIISILRSLACFDIVSFSLGAGEARQGAGFAEAYREKGYFLWLARGYGHLLQNLTDFAKLANRPSSNDDQSFVGRNPKHIATAGRDYGAQFVDQYFADALSQQSFAVACDLGCGSAERLLKIAKTYPETRGVGVDINPEAIAIAQDRIREESLQDRITVSAGDVRNLSSRPEFNEVDLLFCFFMGHDLWPRARCKEVLRGLPRIFPQAKRFLFCDTYRSEAKPSPYIPTFTLGFELTHAVMGQYIPNEQEWLALFEETEWKCVGKQEVGIPFSAIFDLRRAASTQTS